MSELRQTAIVRRVDGQRAWVVADQGSACGSCGSQGGCGVSVLGRVLGQREIEMEVHNPLSAQPGEAVTVAMPAASFLAGAAAIYLLPLLGLFAGGLIGGLLAEHWRWLAVEAGSVGLGGAGFIYGLLLARRRIDRRVGAGLFSPKVVARNSAQPLPVGFDVGSGG